MLWRITLNQQMPQVSATYSTGVEENETNVVSQASIEVHVACMVTASTYGW